MAILKAHKVVSALPSTLEADSIYFVRVGAGFDMYTTNSSGIVIASKINPGVSMEQGITYSNDFYIYIVFGNTTAWEVYRYDRSNNLIKTMASGTGVKPNTIASLEALTYI